MLKEGTLPPGMKFEDDNILKYDPRYDPKRAEKASMLGARDKDLLDYKTQTSASHKWQEESDRFSKDARELKRLGNQPGKSMSKRKVGKAQALNSSQTNLNGTQEPGSGAYNSQPAQGFPYAAQATGQGAAGLDGAGQDLLAGTFGSAIPGAGGLMNTRTDLSPQRASLAERGGIPTSMDEVTNAREWLLFVEHQKRHTEASGEDDREKPRFADQCVDFPRDAPRDDAKCCHSKLHELL